MLLTGQLLFQGKILKSRNLEFNRWIHPIFTGASFSYLLTMIDKIELIANSFVLQNVTGLFIGALVANAIWSVIYYMYDAREILEMNRFTKRFSSSAQWMFLAACAMLIYYMASSLSEMR